MIRFDFMQSTYRCCIKILTEAAYDNEFSMPRIEMRCQSDPFIVLIFLKVRF